MIRKITDRLLSLLLALCMVAGLLPAVFVTAGAADYSIGSGDGFKRNADSSITATFTVSNNNLDMRGWLLCLMSSKPAVNSATNKLTDADDAHPYSYSNCAYYFAADSTDKTGQITLTWAADAVDQKGKTKTLSQVINEQDWHIVIGPRHYNTGWGDSGIGAGTDGIWESCDYYVGAQSEVLVDTSRATFDPSNGEPVVKSVDAPQDPTYKDYTFEGWYDQPNGWGTKANGSFTLGNTYYAHYTKDGKTVYTRTLDFTNGAAFTPPDSGDGYTLERNKQVTITENGRPTDWQTDCLTLDNILVDTVDLYGIKVPGDKYPGFCIDLPAGTESTITGGRVIVTSEDVPRVAGLQGGKYLLLTGSGTLNVTGNDIISDDNGSPYNTISYGISMSKTLDAQLIVDGPTVNASGGKGLHSTKWWMTSSVGIRPYIFMFNGKLTARGNEVASRGSHGTSNGITIYDGEFYAYGNDSGIGDGSGSDITTYGGKIYATGKTRATATYIYDKSMSFTGLAILKGSLEYNAPSDTLTPVYYAQGDGNKGPWMDESKTDDQRTKTLLIYHEPELIVTGKSSFAYGADATGETYTVNAAKWKTKVGDSVAVENAKIFFGAEGEELTEITDSVTFTDNFEESEKGTATAAFTGLDLTGKNVGKYTLKITATDPEDDTKAGVVEGTLDITVTSAEIDAPTGKNNTFTYDGTEKTFTPDGYDADTAAYMLSGNTETDAGSYTATLSLKDKANTVWKDTKKAEDRTLPYTIKKATAAPEGVPVNKTITMLTGRETTGALTPELLGLADFDGGMTLSNLGKTMDSDNILTVKAADNSYTIANTDKATSATATVKATSKNYELTVTVTFQTVALEFKVGDAPATADNAVTLKEQPLDTDTWGDIVTVSDSLTASVRGTVSTDAVFTTSPAANTKPTAGNAVPYSVLFTGTVDGEQFTDVVVFSSTVKVYPGAPGAGYTVDYRAETLAPVAGNEIRKQDGDNWSAWSDTPDFESGASYEVRTKETVDAPASTPYAFTLAARPAAPAVAGVDETVQNKSDGKVTGVDGTMEYSTDNGGSWTPVDEGKAALTGLAGGATVQVRKQATDSAPYGETATVTIAASTVTLTVKFDANGGTGTAADAAGLAYGSLVPTPAAPGREGYELLGWAVDRAGTISWDFANSRVTGDMTLYAQWKQNGYNVSGNVLQQKPDGSTETAGSGVAVKSVRGNVVFGTATTDLNGSYTLANVPAGTYNIVAEKGGKTMTALVTISGNMQAPDIVLPYSKVSSELEVKTGTPNVIVGGLDAEAASNADAVDPTGTLVTVKMTAEKKEAEDAAQAEEIRQAAGAQSENLTYLDIKLEKTVNNGAPSALSETANLLEIIVPFDTAGKTDFKVYRYHGANVQTLTTTPNEYGEHIKAGNGSVTIYARRFSTYAIGYTVYTSSGDSGVGGGAAAAPSYPVNTPTATSGGKVSTDPKSAPKGETVTITVTPEDGYTLDTLTVTDKDGNKLPVTAVGGGKYAFTMPEGAVSIAASFKAASAEGWKLGYQTCPLDEACPLWPYTDVKSSDWYHDGVHFCMENGLMNGYSDGSFKPAANTTRAMIATILYRLEGAPAVSGTAFSDVAAGAYYHDAVLWAQANGVVKGYGDGTFGPDNAVTREQMAAILHRYAQYKGYDVSVGENTNILSYGDAERVEEYAIPAMQWACGAGVVTGKQGASDLNLDPKGSTTRAEMATMMMRFCAELVK